jgi:hypothetical protein
MTIPIPPTLAALVAAVFGLAGFVKGAVRLGRGLAGLPGLASHAVARL